MDAHSSTTYIYFPDRSGLRKTETSCQGTKDAKIFCRVTLISSASTSILLYLQLVQLSCLTSVAVPIKYVGNHTIDPTHRRTDRLVRVGEYYFGCFERKRE